MATKQVNKPIIVVEAVKEVSTEEEWFPRKKCNSCTTNNMIGIILLKDSNRLCFICYDLVKKLSNLKLDDIHEIDITAAKKYILDNQKTQEKTDEHVPQVHKGRVSRGSRRIKAAI